MGAWKLQSAKLLGNHGAQVVYRRSSRGARGERVRFVPPRARVTVREAAVILGTYWMLVHRLVGLERVKHVKVAGMTWIPLSECRRLKRAWAGGWPSTVAK